jgi:CDP-diacylglycerol--serine O-phosphatidyltransferase
VGLPIPAAAGQLATIVYFAPEAVSWGPHCSLVLALVVILAFLMVSTVRYRSFKGLDLRKRRSYINVLGIAVVFVFIATHPAYALLAWASIYTLSGPIAYLAGMFRRRHEPPPAVTAGEAHFSP